MDYLGIQCPICYKPFDKDSDIVVCPDCGTPVHRACYAKLGHCCNESKHASGYVWKMPYDPEREKRQKEEEARRQELRQRRAAENEEQQDHSGLFGIGYDDVRDGEESQFRPNMRVLGPNEKIGDYTAQQYAEVIQKNSRRYIPKFFVLEKTGRKVSLNMAGFFFPVLWLAYRKMYKYAIIAMVATLIIPVIFMNKIYHYYEDTTRAAQEYLMSAPDEVSEEDEEALEEAENTPQPKALVVNSYLQLVVSLVVGLYGNYWYRKRCDKLLADAASRDGPERTKFLARHGGTSALNCAIALLLMYLIVMFVGGIALKTDTDLATIVWRLFQ